MKALGLILPRAVKVLGLIPDRFGLLVKVVGLPPLVLILRRREELRRLRVALVARCEGYGVISSGRLLPCCFPCSSAAV